MNRRIIAPLVLIAATAGLASFLANHLVVTTDITQLLSSNDDKRQASLIRAVADSELSRTLIVSLATASSDEAALASEAFVRHMAGHPEVDWVQSGSPDGIEEAVYSLYFPRRMAFIEPRPATELPTRLSDSGLQAAAARLKEQLALPTAPLVKRLATSDPLLSFPDLVARFDAARPAELALHSGRFVSADGLHAIVFIGTRHGPLDATAQGPFLEAIDAAGPALASELGFPVRIEIAGIHPFGVDGRRSIETDVSRISTISILAIAALLIWALRSLRLILLAMLPLVVGLLSGLASGLAVFGEIHGLTLAFAATLIGVCIDYPIHAFTGHVLAPIGESPERSMAHTWPGVTLGAVTTALGFASLALSGLPGLAEVGVVCAAGIVAALLVTRFVLPSMMTPVGRTHGGGLRLVIVINRLLLNLSGRRRALATATIVAIGLVVVTLPAVEWSGSLGALSARNPEILAEDTRVRERISAVEPGRLLVAVGANEEEALRHMEVATETLQILVERHVLFGFRSLETWLWSAERQRQNLGTVAAADLGRRLPPLFADAGFNANAFAPFVAAVDQTVEPLIWNDLVSSPLEPLVRPFRIDLPSGWSDVTAAPGVGFLIFLQSVANESALSDAVSTLDGVTYVDQKSFMDRAYTSYRERSTVAVLVGVCVLFLVVGLRYRNVSLVFIAAAPALLASGLTIGVLGAFGNEINIIHLVSLLLVTAIGFDYGIFLAESSRADVAPGSTLVAVVFSAVTTLLGFGLLGISANPAMRAIGMTVTLGIVATLVLAPCIVMLARPLSLKVTDEL